MWEIFSPLFSRKEVWLQPFVRTPLFTLTFGEVISAFWCILFLASNFGMNCVASWIMSQVPAPIYQSCVDSVLGIITLGCFTNFGSGQHAVTAFDEKFFLLSLYSCLFMVSVVSNNASYVHISIPLNQLIKGCIPLPTLIFTFLLTRHWPRRSTMLSVFLIVFGTSLAIPFGTAKAPAIGIILALLSTLSTAARQSFAEHLMARGSGFKIEPIALAYWQSVFSVPVLLALWLSNFDGERDVVFHFWAHSPGKALGLASIAAASSISYTLIMFYFTRLTSSLTLSVAGSFKLLLLVVIPALFDPHLFSVINWFGAALCFIGLCVYSYIGHKLGAGAAVTEATQTDLLSKEQRWSLSRCCCP